MFHKERLKKPVLSIRRDICYLYEIPYELGDKDDKYMSEGCVQ